MSLAALALAAAVAAGPADDAYRAALETLYDGATDTALVRLAALSRDHSDDPMGPYLEALALCWKIEERADRRDLDPLLRERTEQAIERADARLASDPADARALLARGAAHGARSRLALFRVQRLDAAREAARMRTDLLEVHRLDPGNEDALFGLGLYDYYADVLPRAAKILRFLLGLPGGDRRRGLAEMRAARDGCLFHETEVRAQLYEVLAFYEEDADAADAEMEGLHRRYPGSPLWALELSEHRRERMGDYRGSAAVAREVIAAAASGHPNFAPVVAEMARLSLGESLLRDLRFAQAEEALRAASKAEGPRGARAQLLLGETLELDGRRGKAVEAYRAASRAADRDVRRAAEQALGRRRAPAEIEALDAVARARRSVEANDLGPGLGLYVEAATLWPDCREAQVGAAAAALAAGRLDEAARRLDGTSTSELCGPPWVEPWSRLLRARLADAAGDRGEALRLYNDVFQHPLGRSALRQDAAAGLREPWRPPEAPHAAAGTANHSK